MRAAARVDFGGKIVGFHPAQHGGFESAEAEVERVAFHAREREFDGARIAVGRELIDDGAAGIAEAEQLRDFVVSFACRVVARFAEKTVGEALADFEQVGVAAADDQRERRDIRWLGPASSITAWMWPSMWFTAMSGRLRPLKQSRAPWRK